MNKCVAVLFLATCLSGCATNWSHPTASQAQFQSDSLSCQDRANQAVPRTYVPIQQPAPVYNPSYSTTCMNMGVSMVSCETTSNAPIYSPQMAQANQAMAQGGADFARAFGLSSYYDSCMQSKGYSKSTASSSSSSGGSSAPYTAFNQVINGISVTEKSQCFEPEFKLYFKKTTCKPEELSLEYTGDNSKATSLEQKQILLIDAENKKHELALINAYKSLYPNKNKADAYVVLLLNINSLNDTNIKNLYQQKISWGDYNSKRKEIALKFKNDSSKIESQY